MKFLFFTIGLMSLFCLTPSFSLEEASSDFDIDSLFNEPLPDNPSEPDSENDGRSPVADLVRQRGITFDASFEFLAGISPGWNGEFTWGQRAKMRADLSLDARISEVFRVKTSIYFGVPDFEFSLGDFFFDYNIFDVVFVRAGKYSHTWGISPNFGFTDLLSRVPETGFNGDSFIFKVNIPDGIGGFEVLAQTRADLMGGEVPGWRSIGFGGKYNLALRWADFDLGAFYEDDMPFRGFFSVKFTLGKTELYNEWLGVNFDKPKDFSGAVNLGLARDFFDDRLGINAEAFYNAEKRTFRYRPETNIREADISPFVEGFNLALNLIYRFRVKTSPRLFVQAFYAPGEDSALLVPGIRLSPLSHTELYLAVPMALGKRDGYYYSNTPDPDNRPFCIVLLLKLNGSVRSGYYY